MRILFYFAWPVDTLGGAELATQNLAEGLLRHGHDVGIIEMLRDSPSASLLTRTFGGPVWSLQADSSGQSARSWAVVFGQFRSIEAKFDPDILSVQCPSWQAAPVIGASTLPHRWRLAVALHGTEMLQDAGNPRLRPWLNRLFSAAAAITVVSESLRRDFNARYPMVAHKARVIHNGIEPGWASSAEAPRIAPHVRYVLYAGRFDRIKGIDILLRAWKKVEACQRELWLAGAGAEEDGLRALARDLGLGGQVRFVGLVAQSDLPALYRNAELVVIPSRHEGLPRVALEAGACGAVCVATRVGGVAEVISDPDTGFLVAPESPEALADGLVRALRLTSEDRRRVGAAARNRILQQFTHARTVADYEQLFRSLLEPAVRP